jgi:hypothetical protein
MLQAQRKFDTKPLLAASFVSSYKPLKAYNLQSDVLKSWIRVKSDRFRDRELMPFKDVNNKYRKYIVESQTKK